MYSLSNAAGCKVTFSSTTGLLSPLLVRLPMQAAPASWVRVMAEAGTLVLAVKINFLIESSCRHTVRHLVEGDMTRFFLPCCSLLEAARLRCISTLPRPEAGCALLLDQ